MRRRQLWRHSCASGGEGWDALVASRVGGKEVTQYRRTGGVGRKERQALMSRHVHGKKMKQMLPHFLEQGRRWIHAGSSRSTSWRTWKRGERWN